VTVAYKSAVDEGVIEELRGIIGDEDRVLPGMSSRVNRTRVPAPFPVHRWADHMPDVAILPRTAEEVSEVVKLANRLRIPIVPRAGGTGLSDGAVPLRGGILVDVKLMNQIHEIDLVDRTVTVGPGINMLKLNEELRKHNVFYPDDPASYPCSLVGGRIGTGGWSLLGARFGHTRDNVISMQVVLPTGEIAEIGEGGGRKLRRSSTALNLKQLFTGHQGTLGITTEGVKIPLGLWEGSTENATVATALLADLVERGLDPEQGILFVIDGAKALRKAIRNVFGEAPVQRCLRHKERNVIDHLPERERPAVKERLRRAWALEDHARALDQLRRLAGELDRAYPGAAGSLREGVEETLTLTRLGVTGSLRRTLESTNPCESMIEIVRRTQRNVKRWSSGEMALRWTAAGMLEAEKQFRKIIGYRDLATLVIAIERDHEARHRSVDAAHTPTKEAAIVLTA